MSTNVVSVVATIVSRGEELDSVCRRLATSVNHGPLYLASAVSRGSQIYPVRLDVVGGRAMHLECEFRVRNALSSVDEHAVEDLARRIEAFEVLHLLLLDETGTVVGRIGESRAAG